MHGKRFLTCAALSASFLLPLSGAFAQNDPSDNTGAPADSSSNSATTTESTTTRTDNAGATTTVTDRTTTMTTAEGAGSVMDVGIFRQNLQDLRDLLMQMKENRNLALASPDPLVSSQYEDTNRRLLVQTLGLLDGITRHWRRAELPPNAVAVSDTVPADRYGAADLQRFANESEDTAFVRNAVWQIQDNLQADKLNGRDPIISDRMMSLVDAAISRASNPNFVAWRTIDTSRLASIQWPEHKPFEWDRSHDVASANTNSEEWQNWRAEMAPPVIPEGTHYNTNQVAAANPTVEETTAETRAGAANLPQTGGDPGMLFFLGSGFAGLGAFLRRRRA